MVRPALVNTVRLERELEQLTGREKKSLDQVRQIISQSYHAGEIGAKGPIGS